MHAVDIGPKDIQGIGRIGLAIHEQVRRVQIDAQVTGPYILDGSQQGHRRLLAGLKPKAQAMPLAVGGDGLEGLDQAGVKGIRRALGDEPHMGGDTWRPDMVGEIGPLFEDRQPHRPARLRGQANRARSLDEIPNVAARHARPEGGNLHSFICARRPEAVPNRLSQPVRVPTDHLTRLEPQLANFLHRFLWPLLQTDENPQLHVRHCRTPFIIWVLTTLKKQ